MVGKRIRTIRHPGSAPFRHRFGIAVIWLATAGIGPPSAFGQEPSGTVPPPGLGSLHREDIAVPIEAGNVLIQVVPLDEGLLRLLAPDTYAGLHGVRRARSARIAEEALRHGVLDPSLFLVTVFGREEQAPFDPERLTIQSRGRFYRPVAIMPITPLWNQNRVGQRETAAAIYIFENGITLSEPLVVDYAGTSSDHWGTVLSAVERERARVAAKTRYP